MNVMDVVVVNPFSGRGAALRNFRRESPEGRVLISEYPGHIRQFLSHGGYDRVHVFGGDGTLHEAVNGVMEAGQDAEIILHPSGTGNDFMKSLKPGRSRPDIIAIEMPDKTEYAVNTCGIGFATAVVRQTSGKKMGKVNYLARALVTLLGNRRFYVRIKAGKYMEMEVFQVDICNGMFYGGGMKVSPESDPYDGMLDVLYSDPLGYLEAVSLISRIYKGTHTSHPKIHSFRAKVMEIFSEHTIHGDGEIIGKGPARISTAKGPVFVRDGE